MAIKRKSIASRRKAVAVVLGLGIACAVAATAWALFNHNRSSGNGSADLSRPQQIARSARTLGVLLEMAPDQLAKVDIAEMNLLCATGLPGAEGVDIDRCLAVIDGWAERVKSVTERHLYRLTDPRFADHAEHYKHSEARFRAEWLVNVLQQDIGLHYHAGFEKPDQSVVLPKTSKECFIHGLMDNDDPHKALGGNCLSLPVAYAAVGRRLGYPIKLVLAKEHSFCRWEGLDNPNPAWRDRFNFDGAGEGFSIDPDEFYLSWPRKTTADQVELGGWLQSLTPQQELAVFLTHRGIIQQHLSKDPLAALVSTSQSLRLWPASYPYLQELLETSNRLWVNEVATHPDIFRRLNGVQVVSGRVVPCEEPARQKANHDALDAIEAMEETRRRNMARAQSPGIIPGPPMVPPPSPYGPAAPRPYQPPIPGPLPR